MELHTAVAADIGIRQTDILLVVESKLRRVLQRGGIHEALDSLRTVSEELRLRGDARAIFPDIYSVITENVEKAIEGGAFFQAPEFISRLAGRFASLYLESLERSLTGRQQLGSPWRLAYRRARVEEALPLEHAALGISAHINFDLTLGIYETIQWFGAAGDPATLARFKHDHDAVNALLEASLPECLFRLTHLYGCPATPMLTGWTRRWATRRIMRVLRRWRDRVWDNVLQLLDTPTEAGRIAIIARMEQTALREGSRLSALCRAARRLMH